MGQVFITIIYGAVITLNALEITFLVRVLRSDKSSWKLTDTMLLNLAIADFSMGVCGLGGHAASKPFRIDFAHLNVYVRMSLDATISHSMFTVMLLTWDRIIAVYFPYRRRLITQQIIVIILVCSWVISLLLAVVVNVYDPTGENGVERGYDTAQILLCILFLMLAYYYVWKKIYKQRAVSDSSNVAEPVTQQTTESKGPPELESIPIDDNDTSPAHVSKDVEEVTDRPVKVVRKVPYWRRKRERSAFIISVLIVVCFVVCFLPVAVINILWEFIHADYLRPYKEVARLMPLVSSVINPLLYFGYRYRNIFNCCCRKK